MDHITEIMYDFEISKNLPDFYVREEKDADMQLYAGTDVKMQIEA